MKQFRALASSAVASTHPYVGVAVVLGLTVFAGPAMAQIPTAGLETFTTDIWDFLIKNVGLMVVGLGIIGAIIGAMVASPGRGVAAAIGCAALGAFLGGVPALAEYVIGLGGA